MIHEQALYQVHVRTLQKSIKFTITMFSLLSIFLLPVSEKDLVVWLLHRNDTFENNSDRHCMRGLLPVRVSI